MDTIPKLFWKRLEKMSLDEERIFYKCIAWSHMTLEWPLAKTRSKSEFEFRDFSSIPNFDPIDRGKSIWQILAFVRSSGSKLWTNGNSRNS